MAIKDRAVAQEAAKKSWLNRDLPNWRDQVGDLLKRETNHRQRRTADGTEFTSPQDEKGVQALRFMIGASKFAVVAEGKFRGKFQVHSRLATSTTRKKTNLVRSAGLPRRPEFH
jgi:hypothetical protein